MERARQPLLTNLPMDDAGMVRVYARENATQRGNTGTATAGAIASTVRILAKAMLRGTLETLLINLGEEAEDPVDIAQVRGHFLGRYGMGRDLIWRFLKRISGMNKPRIDHQLALLKESGHYDRLIPTVRWPLARPPPL